MWRRACSPAGKRNKGHALTLTPKLREKAGMGPRAARREERKIRTDPAARVTDLLKMVFRKGD